MTQNVKNCVFLIKGNKNIKILKLLDQIKKIMGLKSKISFGKNILNAHYLKYPDKFVEPKVKHIKFNEKISLDQGLLLLMNYMKKKYEKFRKI